MSYRMLLFALILACVPTILYFSTPTRGLCRVTVALPSLLGRCRRAADQVTFGIKSFGRPEAALRLAQSIRAQGYTSPILVIDDGHNNSAHVFSKVTNLFYHKLEFDVGISAGRNFAVEQTRTPYFMTLDDDFVFTRSTDVDRLLEVLEARNLDFVSGRLDSSSVGHFVELGEQVLYCIDEMARMEEIEGTGCVYTQRTTNFFVARQAFLAEHPWSNELKLVEHTPFFVGLYRAGARGAHCPSVQAAHKHPNNGDEYKAYRNNWGPYDQRIAGVLGKRLREDCDSVHQVQARLFLPPDYSAGPPTFSTGVYGPATWHLPDAYMTAAFLRPIQSLVIDLGSGPDLARMFRAGYDVLGLAVSGERLTAARQAMQAAHEQHPELTNYGEGSVVLCGNVIEHVPDPVGLLRGLRLALERGVFAVILATPDRTRSAGVDRPPGHPFPLREWSLEELVQLVQFVGLPLRQATWTRPNNLTTSLTTSLLLLSEHEILLPAEQEFDTLRPFEQPWS